MKTINQMPLHRKPRLHQHWLPAAYLTSLVLLGMMSYRLATPAIAQLPSVSSDDFVRQSAVDVLAKLGGQEVVEPLSWALREDPEPSVRYEALMNLAEIGGDRVRDILRQALDDPEELVRTKGAEILHLQGAGGDKQ